MANQAQFQAAIDKLNGATTAAGDAIKALVEKLQNAGVSGDVEDAALAQFNQIGDALIQMAADVNNPVPVEPQPVV